MTDPRRTGPAVTHGWVLGTRSNACPLCLQENRIWPTRWRLLWCVGCTRHRVGLIDKCPNCASPMMSLRQRLRIVPGATVCHCGHELEQATATTPSPGLLNTQDVLNLAMDGRSVDLAGDLLDPAAFFVVFRTIAELIRATGYDLDGNSWSQRHPPSQQREISADDLKSIQTLLERAGTIFTISAPEAQAPLDELRNRAAQQQIQVAWRFRKHRLEPSRIGRIGRILTNGTPDL
jgi:hypothetical protein